MTAPLVHAALLINILRKHWSNFSCIENTWNTLGQLFNLVQHGAGEDTGFAMCDKPKRFRVCHFLAPCWDAIHVGSVWPDTYSV